VVVAADVVARSKNRPLTPIGPLFVSRSERVEKTGRTPTVKIHRWNCEHSDVGRRENIEEERLKENGLSSLAGTLQALLIDRSEPTEWSAERHHLVGIEKTQTKRSGSAETMYYIRTVA